MIFFNFGPFSKHELTIDFDEEGATSFFLKISALLDGTRIVERVDCLRSFRGHLEEAIIELHFGVLDRLEMKKNLLLLNISPDALEYGLHQLGEFLKKGYFFPSEFWIFSRENRKFDTQVFFGRLSSTR